jgi:hypothetical protein
VTKPIDLTTVHNEPSSVREALAFYVSFGVVPTNYTAAERERHYSTLEEAGYIEKVGGTNALHI